MFQIARGESDPEVRKTAIEKLGLAGGREELAQLYNAESSTEVKKYILHGLFLNGAVDRISNLARNEQNHLLRLEAIHKPGLMGKRSTETLSAMYREEENKDVKEKILQALFLQGNATALIEIARAEQDPELKKYAVQRLSLMGSEEAKGVPARDSQTIKSERMSRKHRLPTAALVAAALMTSISAQQPTATLRESVQDDPNLEVKETAVFGLSQLRSSEGVPLLIDVARTHRDPRIRKKAMFWLGQSNDPRALGFFEEILLS